MSNQNKVVTGSVEDVVKVNADIATLARSGARQVDKTDRVVEKAIEVMLASVGSPEPFVEFFECDGQKAQHEFKQTESGQQVEACFVPAYDALDEFYEVIVETGKNGKQKKTAQKLPAEYKKACNNVRAIKSRVIKGIATPVIASRDLSPVIERLEEEAAAYTPAIQSAAKDGNMEEVAELSEKVREKIAEVEEVRTNPVEAKKKYADELLDMADFEMAIKDKLLGVASRIENCAGTTVYLQDVLKQLRKMTDPLA